MALTRYTFELDQGRAARKSYNTLAFSLIGRHFMGNLRFGAALAAGLLSSIWLAPIALAGTGGGMQVPNVPTGGLTQAGLPGICQCISVNTARQLPCLSHAAACEEKCGRSYSFVPDARQSCGAERPLTGSSMPPSQRRR